ncbi:DUF427 domain-containing protein [Cognatishimia maritima]|uniref:Uncharacterized conserved protein, DUF427 family n=1 Tax=Cognatishimia maritima TaxID=870908 RepID=A0A1M5W009_9RHOB|nr:DUF427 domain-containing protein [Cognatishimia maritima]SHH80748.1 Uncharacterized conserved protein, DUF427 family [Cognatishimia maritima]
MSHPDITLAEDTIHNPSEPRHYMSVESVSKHISIRCGEVTLADTSNALRLLEIGRHMYAPVIYVPKGDVACALEVTARESHCPLKGDCSWFSVNVADGEDIAWSYESPFPFAAVIAGYVAFDAERVTIEESPK